MANFFRRMRSPREREDQDPSAQGFTGKASRSAHRRHRSDESSHIIRTVPEDEFFGGSHLSQPLDDQTPFPGEDAVDNPPLPPRNVALRPASVSNPHLRSLTNQSSVDDDPYYLAPADTIRRGPANLVLPSGPAPTKSEQRQMELHQRTLSQKQQQDQVMGGAPSLVPSGHRRTGSFGHIMDSSEYSTPWNLLQQQQREREAHVHGHPPGHVQGHPRTDRHHHSVVVTPSTKSSTKSTDGAPKKPHKYWASDPTQRSQIHSSQVHDPADEVIVVQGGIPSNEGSRNNSPSTPPAAGSAPPTSAPPAPPPSIRKEEEYEEPWDLRHKNLQFPTRRSRNRLLEDEQPRHGSVGSRPHLSHAHNSSPHLLSRYGSHGELLPPPPTHHPPPPPTEPSPPPPEPKLHPLHRHSPPVDDTLQGVTTRSYSSRERTHTSPTFDDGLSQRNHRGSSERWGREMSPGFHPGPSLSQPEISRVGSSTGIMPYHREATRYHPPSTDFLSRSASSSSVPIRNRRLPSPPTDLLTSSSGVGGGQRFSRTDSPSPSHIDLSLPLEEQPFYHGPITRADAEGILANERDFSFLVRNSESCRTDFSLSIRDHSCGFIHLRIVYERGGYVLGQFSNPFNTVPECIAFYTRQRLNIRGADHKRLHFPVARMA